jgi:hypothetical protein
LVAAWGASCGMELLAASGEMLIMTLPSSITVTSLTLGEMRLVLDA